MACEPRARYGPPTQQGLSSAGVGAAKASERSARSAQTNEVQQRQLAQAREIHARRIAYVSDMNLAHQALEEETLGRALELLDRYRPRPGEKDLRGWEWRYLRQSCRSDESFSLGGHSNSVAVTAFS